jgi:CRISPR system Cascade subunit CasC
MKRFVQGHFLTSFPPSCLNRDDTNRPKTCLIGGFERGRISSQCWKRTIRTSTVFQQACEGHMGIRTQRLGEEIEKRLVKRGASPEMAKATARQVAAEFGTIVPEKDPNPTRTAQLTFISPQEWEAALARAEEIAAGKTSDASDLLLHVSGAADMGMFGRMLAERPDFNIEAAVQIGHSFTTHRMTIEDDFYTAVDDLKLPSEDAGAGFLGEQGFGAGVFYTYVNIDRRLLLRNLDGDEELAKRAVGATIEALATVSPGGKQSSFASRARASFILAERGDGQPRTLAEAFLRPVRGDDLMRSSINALISHREKMDRAYGPSTDAPAILDVEAETGTLADVIGYMAE